MMQNAAEAFIPGDPQGRNAPAEKAAMQEDDLAEMRAQMAAMQKKLDEMSK